MDSPTQAQIERARHICASKCTLEKQAALYTSGKRDHSPEVICALAAIIETQEAIEALEIKLPGVSVGLADGAAIARRQILDHLKGTPNAE